jgi:hypothetical protein
MLRKRNPFKEEKTVKKTLFVIPLTAILVILNACTTPSTTTAVYPTQTPASTPTAVPPTPTSLPPTPALEGLLLSGETLSTAIDGVSRYALTRTGWEPIPPEDLSDELANLEGWDYAQSEQGALQIVDLEGNPLWIEISGLWIQLSADLPEGWQLVNDGKNIVDADGTPVPWMRLEDGKMIIDIRLSLDKAKQAVAETISIKGDYGYNQKGGIVSMFDDEKGDWIPIPFGEEDADELVPFQWVGSPGNLFTQEVYVGKVTKYGAPNEGAISITDPDSGEIVSWVALSIDAMSQNSQGEWQVTKVPAIWYSADGKKVVVLNWTTDNSADPRPFESFVEENLPTMIYYNLPKEEQALYSDPLSTDPSKRYDQPTAIKPELGRGDQVLLSYLDLVKGSKSAVSIIYKIVKVMGLNPSSLNDASWYKNYLETGDLPNSADDNQFLFPDELEFSVDAEN